MTVSIRATTLSFHSTSFRLEFYHKTASGSKVEHQIVPARDHTPFVDVVRRLAVRIRRVAENLGLPRAFAEERQPQSVRLRTGRSDARRIPGAVLRLARTGRDRI